MASIAIGDSGVRSRCASEPKQDPKRQREGPKHVKKFRHKNCFLLHKFHLALAHVYSRYRLAEIDSVGFFPSRVEADQAGNHHRKEELPADPFDDGKPARNIAARHDVAIAESGDRDEAEVDRAHP